MKGRVLYGIGGGCLVGDEKDEKIIEEKKEFDRIVSNEHSLSADKLVTRWVRESGEEVVKCGCD